MKKTTKKMARRPARPKTLEELSDFYDAHREDETLWSKKPMKVKIGSSTGSIVFSLRFSPSELEDLRGQAKARGLTLSEMIRRAALDWGQSHRYQVVVQPQPNIEISISRTRSLAAAITSPSQAAVTTAA